MLHSDPCSFQLAHLDLLSFPTTYWCSHAESLVSHRLSLKPCRANQQSSDLNNPSQHSAPLGYQVYHLFWWDSNSHPSFGRTHRGISTIQHRWLASEDILLQRMHTPQQHGSVMPVCRQNNLHASQYVYFHVRSQRRTLSRWI